MIDLLPRGGSIHVDGGHSLPVVVLCCFLVVLPVFERGAVCVVPVLVSLIFSVHGGPAIACPLCGCAYFMADIACLTSASRHRDLSWRLRTETCLDRQQKPVCN